MDANSDSSRGEVDSTMSADSLQILHEELNLQHMSTPDKTSADLSKQIAALELDNERLRIDLENARLELSAKNAANQGLKNKIAELYMEAQTSMQDKQKLRNIVKDTECRLVAAENSMKWYQGQMHEEQANKRTLQIEIDTYQNMLRQKSRTLLNVSAKYKQLNEDYIIIVQKHKKEKDILHEQIELLKMKNNSIKNIIPNVVQSQPHSTVPSSAYAELKHRLESAEEELQESRAQLRSLEQRLTSSEEERSAVESANAKQRGQLAAVEERLNRSEAERTELAETGRALGLELGRLRAEGVGLQAGLLAARQEREQVEQAIEQLQSQLSKMIAQHRLLRARGVELEEELAQLRPLRDENERLRNLSCSANAALFRRLRLEKRKIASLQKQLTEEQSRQRLLIEKNKTDASLRDSLKQALERNKELREQLKSSKTSEENVDEGYADGSSVASLSLTSVPSPRPFSPTQLSAINDILLRSKNFWEPVKSGLDELQSKLEYRGYIAVGSTPNACYMPTPPSSPSSNAQSVA